MSKKDAKKETQKDSNKEKITKDGSKGSLSKGPETQQMRRNREKEIVDSLNRENIHRYLKNIEPHKASDQLAQKVAQSTLTLVQHNLEKGIFSIPNAPSPLPQQPKPQPKLSSEEIKEQQIKAKRDQMQKKIDYLYDQIRGENGKSKEGLNVEFKEILSKQEHQQKIQHILAEKAERKRRMEELTQEQQRKRKEEQEREEELRALEKQKRKEEKRNSIQSNLKKRKQEHQKLLSVQKQMQKEFESARSKDRLYQKMEQKYQSEILLPSLEEKKNKLKQLREFHKNYDLEAIREHQKKYSLRQEQLSNELSAKKEQRQHEYRPPPRSDRLSKFLQEQALALKEKLQQRKNKNQEMQRRIYSFEKEVKSKYKPKIDQSKKQQIMQRYLQESRKHQKLSLDPKKLGEEYLEIAKRMSRSERYKKQTQTEEKNEQPAKTSHPSLQVSRAGHRSQEFYQSVRRKRMQSILNSQQHSAMDKYHFLRLESDKIGEKIKQKEELARVSGNEDAQQEAAQLLLTAIKAKMGLMSVLKQRKAPQSALTQE